MKYYIFRNTTLELFFRDFDVKFSDYSDVLNFDNFYDRYIFYYKILNKTDKNLIKKEISSYKDYLKFILDNLESNKSFLIFTLERIVDFNLINSDVSIEKSIIKFNNFIRNIEKTNSNVRVLDINEFYNRFSKYDLIDWKYYFISKMEINPKLIDQFNNWFSNQIRSIELTRKKCLVLDLDNTMWGGVLGEDGEDGIKIGDNYPGNAFSYFQNAIKELKKSGIILTVCSKNNIDDVFSVWNNHTDMVLTKKDFIICKINWENKDKNIIEISQELNIGLDSMVFIDDNPFERELVKNSIPEIVVPEFPTEPYLIPQFVDKLINEYFSVHTLTKEDKTKSTQYKKNFKRLKFERKFSDIDNFISQLKINLVIESLNDTNISRFSQMTQKTNQFNLTTRRYTESDINSLRSKSLIFGLRVKDKFGDNGITGLSIIIVDGENAFIDTFLLSCRVLGKKIENEFMNYILNKLKEKNINYVKSEYIKTSKNIQTEEFYENFNFEVLEKKSNYKIYKLNLKESIFNMSPKIFKVIEHGN